MELYTSLAAHFVIKSDFNIQHQQNVKLLFKAIKKSKQHTVQWGRATVRKQWIKNSCFKIEVRNDKSRTVKHFPTFEPSEGPYTTDQTIYKYCRYFYTCKPFENSYHNFSNDIKMAKDINDRI